MAGKLAIKKKDRRHYFLAALGVRKDGVVVTAVNGAPSDKPKRESHAEHRLSAKLLGNRQRELAMVLLVWPSPVRIVVKF